MQEITKAILAIQQNFDRIVYVTSGEMPDIDVLLTKTKSLGIYLPAGQEYDQCAKLIDKQAFGQSVQLNSQYLSQAHSDKCFYQGSITKYSSVLKPAHIKKLIPGLTFNERHDVTGITVEQLLSKESLGKNDTALLVLDINGAETELKHVLVTLVKVFDSLVIKTAPESLFGETPAPMNTLSNHLKELDLVPIVLPDVSPPYVNLVVNNAKYLTAKEELATQVSALQNKQNELVDDQKDKDTQIAKLTAQLGQQAKGHQETRQQAESLKAQNEKLSADSAQKLIDIEQLAAQVMALQAKHNVLAETLKVENDRLSADSAEKQTANQQIAAQVTALQAKQNELVEGHKNKDAQIIAVTEQRDKEAHSHQKNKNWAESLNKQCAELKVYSVARQKSADLALKLQTKAQIDLDDLREKYQHKHINEQKLVSLISELRTKLQQAAEYYYELQAKHPELNKVTQTQVERSHIEEHQTDNVAELVKKTRPAKRKKRSKQAKSVTRGKS